VVLKVRIKVFLVSRKKRKGVVILVNKWDLVEKMSTRDYEENQRIITVYRCAYSFCIGFDQTAFVKST
jgi:predicted GTPase